MKRHLSTGLAGLGLLTAYAAAVASKPGSAPVKTEPYKPAGVRKPTFTERRKAEKAKRKGR